MDRDMFFKAKFIPLRDNITILRLAIGSIYPHYPLTKVQTQIAVRNKMIDATAVRLSFSLTCVLAWLAGHAQADFGSGTITFDETSYTLYEWGNTSNTSTLTVADDQAIGLDKAFGVDTNGDSTDNVFVRIGFSRDGDNDLDTTDIK